MKLALTAMQSFLIQPFREAPTFRTPNSIRTQASKGRASHHMRVSPKLDFAAQNSSEFDLADRRGLIALNRRAAQPSIARNSFRRQSSQMPALAQLRASSASHSRARHSLATRGSAGRRYSPGPLSKKMPHSTERSSRAMQNSSAPTSNRMPDCWEPDSPAMQISRRPISKRT